MTTVAPGPRDRRIPQHGVGTRVTQTSLGNGTVTAVDARHTTVEFDRHGSRTFLSERAALTRATGEATPEPHAAKPRRARQ
jgi:hypothetical protein